MTSRAVLLIAVFTTVVAVEAQDRPLEPIELRAKSQVGQVATICGTVVAYQCHMPDRTTLLALDKPLSSEGVSIAIAREDRNKFGTGFEHRQAHVDVCATGPVEQQQNRYVVRVRDPGELTPQNSSASRVTTFGGDAFSTCDEGVGVPRLLKDVKPMYTQEAMRVRKQGTVFLEAVVLPDGRVGDVRVLRSLDQEYGLDESAIRSLKGWHFEPGSLLGRPVPVVVTVELQFRLG